MNYLKIKIIIVTFFTYFSITSAQEISLPNSAMKSPETLVISSIEFSGGKTIVNMTVENRIEGGNFCADRNIFIIDQAGNRFKLIKAVNIPACPKTHNFRSIGEKLSFSLEFPPLNPGTGWIDIVEECNDNCFWFYGVTLDPALNKKLNEVFAAASSGKAEESISLFRKILEDIDRSNHGIEGLIYVNIINAATEAGDKVEASVWYKRLLTSGAPRVNYYVKYLNDRGIKY